MTHRPHFGIEPARRPSACGSGFLSTLAGAALLALVGCSAAPPPPPPPPPAAASVGARVDSACAKYESTVRKLGLAVSIAERLAVSAEHRRAIDEARAVLDAACDGDEAAVKERVGRALAALSGILLETAK